MPSAGEPATATRRRPTQAERKADAEMGVVKVVLVGHLERVPAAWGDNAGVQRVTVVLCGDPFADGASVLDREQAVHGVAELPGCAAYVAGKARGQLFKVALESLLIGRTTKGRLRWRDIPAGFELDGLPHLLALAADDAGVELLDFESWQRRRNAQIERIRRGR